MSLKKRVIAAGAGLAGLGAVAAAPAPADAGVFGLDVVTQSGRTLSGVFNTSDETLNDLNPAQINSGLFSGAFHSVQFFEGASQIADSTGETPLISTVSADSSGDADSASINFLSAAFNIALDLDTPLTAGHQGPFENGGTALDQYINGGDVIWQAIVDGINETPGTDGSWDSNSGSLNLGSTGFFFVDSIENAFFESSQPPPPPPPPPPMDVAEPPTLGLVLGGAAGIAGGAALARRRREPGGMG